MDHADAGDKIECKTYDTNDPCSTEGRQKKFKKINEGRMPDDTRESSEHEHKEHAHSEDQQVHLAPVIKNLFRTVTELLNQITGKKDGNKDKKEINEKNDPAGQIPHIRNIHQIVSAVYFILQVCAKTHSYKFNINICRDRP